MHKFDRCIMDVSPRAYGDDILDHGVGGGQAGPQQVRHHVHDLLVQLGEPEATKNISNTSVAAEKVCTFAHFYLI